MATANDLNISQSGIVAFDGTATFTGVTLTAGSGISISNGSGVLGNPTISATGLTSLTLTGDSGGALSPSGNNFNLLGSGSITIAGAGSTLTTQLTGLTNHAVLVGAGTSTITKLAVGTNGQVLIAATGADPAFATLTSSDGSVTFTTGANTLSLQVTGGTTTAKTITGDSGGALSPTGGNWNLLGSGSITTSGAGSTLTTQLTGLTNHAVLVGAGTTTITKIAATANTGAVLQNNSGADPSYSTATYPSTTTINQILFSNAANTVTGITAANSASLVSTSTGVPQWSSTMTNGQLIIGSTGATPTAATLTAGTGITVTNGAGSITIAGTAAVPLSFPTDSGTATPAANALTVHGGANINTSGSGSTVTINVNNQILQPNGSAGAPSYSFTNATNYGLRWDNSSTLMRIEGNGNDIAYVNADTLGTNHTARLSVGGALGLAIITGQTSTTLTLTTVYVGVDTTATRTITLPASPNFDGLFYIIKDQTGSAATNNITVSGNGHNIDGTGSVTITMNYGSLSVLWDGTQWNIV